MDEERYNALEEKISELQQDNATLRAENERLKRDVYVEKSYREAAERQVAELSEDVKRFEWLMQSGAHVAFDRDGENCRLRWEFDPNDEESDEGVNQHGWFDSTRDAIDAARTLLEADRKLRGEE